MKDATHHCFVVPETLFNATQVEDSLTQVQFLSVQLVDGFVLLLQRLAL